MQIKIIMKMLSQFEEFEKVSYLKLRSKEFSDQEIIQVEKLEYFDCVDVTPRDDRIYIINHKVVAFKETYKTRLT